ncbi:hypothetical protein [Metabacillus flavus]|uniref:hypothetical protein n=1 Tax=Metabacillus flavus TaxID=2823519 RepID=UPI003265E936
MSLSNLAAKTEEELKKRVFEEPEIKNIPNNHPVYDILNLDLSVSAMGLVHYFQSLSNRKQ